MRPSDCFGLDGFLAGFDLDPVFFGWGLARVFALGLAVVVLADPALRAAGFCAGFFVRLAVFTAIRSSI